MEERTTYNLQVMRFFGIRLQQCNVCIANIKCLDNNVCMHITGFVRVLVGLWDFLRLERPGKLLQVLESRGNL